ncbi:hypothetical protein ACF046_13785 [Glutamicibacter creatinolyticus]|uniref:hypothetical protein n=1 Tax=Glutamicibacter creatinolyticus TaxID=162496 RepID=UPI0036F49C48
MDWHGEWGVEPGPVKPLPINEVAPGLEVAGPDEELSTQNKALHARLNGISHN